MYVYVHDEIFDDSSMTFRRLYDRVIFCLDDVDKDGHKKGHGVDSYSNSMDSKFR